MGALDFLQSEEQTQQAISPLKDPFSKNCIKAIHIHIYPPSTWSDQRAVCKVEFENGSTGGEQNFKGTDLAAMMTEVQAFIDSLN